MKKTVFEDGQGYIVETVADGDRILEMFNEKNELRIELRVSEEDYFESLDRMMEILLQCIKE